MLHFDLHTHKNRFLMSYDIKIQIQRNNTGQSLISKDAIENKIISDYYLYRNMYVKVNK